MNRRQAKKLIPKNTMYCYKIIKLVGRTLNTKHCPHLVYSECIDDMIETCGELKPVKRPIYVCRFTGINTEEDACLYDDCKVCGVV